MDDNKITFDDWAKTWCDEKMLLDEFKKNTREKMYGLLNHVLGLKENKDGDRKMGTVIGRKRLSLERSCLSDSAEVMAFQLFSYQKFKTLKPFVDKYKSLQVKIQEGGTCQDILGIKQLAAELKDVLRKDTFDTQIRLSDIELMQTLLKYMEIMWEDDVNMEDDKRGSDLLDELQVKTGLHTEITSAMLSGKIRDIKAIINEHEQLERDRQINEKAFKDVNRRDIKKIEKLKGKRSSLDAKEASLHKKAQNLTQRLREFPFGTEPWFNELNSDDKELFDMLYENASDVKAERWERIDRGKLVTLLRESFDNGNLRKIGWYFDVDTIELRIMYPVIASMGKIERWSESFCPEEIQNIMQNTDGINQNEPEVTKLGKILLEQGEEIIKKKLEVSRLIKDMQQLINQYEEQEELFWRNAFRGNSKDLESKIYEIVNRQESQKES